jgi:hypothetical protein
LDQRGEVGNPNYVSKLKFNCRNTKILELKIARLARITRKRVEPSKFGLNYIKGSNIKIKEGEK